jgi:hypothetical protein
MDEANAENYGASPPQGKGGGGNGASPPPPGDQAIHLPENVKKHFTQMGVPINLKSSTDLNAQKFSPTKQE